MSQPRSQPSPASRLAERLGELPSAGLRAWLAALDEQAARGGGEILVTLQVGRCGQVQAIEVSVRYERRVESAGGAT